MVTIKMVLPEHNLSHQTVLVSGSDCVSDKNNFQFHCSWFILTFTLTLLSRAVAVAILSNSKDMETLGTCKCLHKTKRELGSTSKQHSNINQ